MGGRASPSRIAITPACSAHRRLEIASRLDQLIPAFATPMAADEALRRFTRNGIDIALVTAGDAAWHDTASWVWTLPSLHATAHVRVLSVRPNTDAVIAKQDVTHVR